MEKAAKSSIQNHKFQKKPFHSELVSRSLKHPKHGVPVLSRLVQWKPSKMVPLDSSWYQFLEPRSPIRHLNLLLVHTKSPGGTRGGPKTVPNSDRWEKFSRTQSPKNFLFYWVNEFLLREDSSNFVGSLPFKKHLVEKKSPKNTGPSKIARSLAARWCIRAARRRSQHGKMQVLQGLITFI